MDPITLSSGAILTIHQTPFSVSKSLYQALLEESKSVKIEFGTDLDLNLWKDLFIVAMTSKKVEACMWECLKRALYNGEKINEQTFEPVEARRDYMGVLVEVAKYNVTPFLESLRSAYAQALAKGKISL